METVFENAISFLRKEKTLDPATLDQLAADVRLDAAARADLAAVYGISTEGVATDQFYIREMTLGSKVEMVKDMADSLLCPGFGRCNNVILPINL